jgi:hypothetical protein
LSLLVPQKAVACPAKAVANVDGPDSIGRESKLQISIGFSAGGRKAN